jgi:hypothetical protein
VDALPRTAAPLLVFVTLVAGVLAFTVYKLRRRTLRREDPLNEATSVTGERPQFPLRIQYYDPPGTLERTEVVVNETELACELEYFDSSDGDDTVRITDALGRPVTLSIEATRITAFRV